MSKRQRIKLSFLVLSVAMLTRVDVVLAQENIRTPQGLRPENVALPSSRLLPLPPKATPRRGTSNVHRSRVRGGHTTSRRVPVRNSKSKVFTRKTSPKSVKPSQTIRRYPAVVHKPKPASAPKAPVAPPAQPTPEVPPAQNSPNPVAGRLPSHWQATVLDHPSSAPPIPLPPPLSPGVLGQEAGNLLSTPSQGSSPQNSGNVPNAGNASGKLSSEALKTSQDRVLLPVSSAVGIAAYRSGTHFIVVFDNPDQLNTSALHGDGIFSTLTANNVPGATIIQLQVPDTRRLFLSHQDEGWVLGDKPPPGDYYSNRHTITPRIFHGGLLYPMRRPGRVLSIDDPVSHQRLLVGTTQLDDGGLLDFRKGSGYDIWPSLEGVVVPVYSPQVGMRATPYGPLLTNALGPIDDLYKAVYANKVDQDWLGLQKLPLIGLQKRLYDAFIDAVDSDPGQRFEKRHEEAKAAFSLGAFIEARGILTVALEDDPEEGLRPDVGFLLSASELLSGRVDDAALLGSQWPEDAQRATQLWRGLYFMEKGGHEVESAHMLAQDFARLSNYPLPVRDIIEPLAAEQIARYGKDEDFPALENLSEGDPYQLAKAFVLLRKNHRINALQIFNTLSLSRDPIVAEKAFEQKTLLDMSDKALTPLTAANKFASLLPDARLAGREKIVRLLQANAYMRAKKWGAALSALDEAQNSPEPHDEPMLGVMLFQNLAQIARGNDHGDTRENTIRNAAMLRGHLSMVPQGNMKGEILVAYGRMLLDLGLFNEARMAFSSALPMLDQAKEMHTLAAIGLANSYLAEDNLPQANSVLAEADTSSMSPEMKAMKRRMQARVDYKAGEPGHALFLLKNDMSDDSLDFRARLHENRGEWKRAVAIVRRMVETNIPPKGDLDSQKQLLALRLASDASSANDRGTMLWLTQLVGSRVNEGESGRVFQLLTRNVLGKEKPSTGDL